MRLSAIILHMYLFSWMQDVLSNSINKIYKLPCRNWQVGFLGDALCCCNVGVCCCFSGGRNTPTRSKKAPKVDAQTKKTH